MPELKFTEFSGLLNMGVTDFSKPQNELSAMKNVYEYKIGKLEKVPGYSLAVDEQVVNDKDINILHHYYQSANKVNYLVVGSDSGTAYTLRFLIV